MNILRTEATLDSSLEPRLQGEEVLLISVISEVELFSGRSSLTQEGRKAIETLLKGSKKIPVSSEIAKEAGMVRLRFGVEIPDALIAATALLSRAALITRNIRHFQAIKNLQLLFLP